MFEGLFGAGQPAPVKNAPGKIFGGLFSSSTPAPTPAPVVAPTASTSTVKVLPSGGALNVGPNGTQDLINTGHTTYGGDMPTKPGFERADIVPVSLGGSNQSPANLTYEPYSTIENFKKTVLKLFGKGYIPQTATDQYLKTQILPDYKAGKISLNEARVKAISFLDNEQKGIKTDVASNIIPGAAEIPGQVNELFKGVFPNATPVSPAAADSVVSANDIWNKPVGLTADAKITPPPASTDTLSAGPAPVFQTNKQENGLTLPWKLDLSKYDTGKQITQIPGITKPYSADWWHRALETVVNTPAEAVGFLHKSLVDLTNVIGQNEIPKTVDEVGKTAPITPAQRIAAGGQAALATANLIPEWQIFNTALNTAEQTPSLSTAANAIKTGFEYLNKGGAYGAGKLIDILPLSSQDKADLKPIAENVGGFLTQFLVLHALGKGVKAVGKMEIPGQQVDLTWADVRDITIGKDVGPEKRAIFDKITKEGIDLKQLKQGYSERLPGQTVADFIKTKAQEFIKNPKFGLGTEDIAKKDENLPEQQSIFGKDLFTKPGPIQTPESTPPQENNISTEIKTMNVVPLDEALQKFKDIGSATLATRSDGARLILKDEGDHVKLGIDTGSLVSTDIKLPSKVFGSAEEAINYLDNLNNSGAKKLVDVNAPSNEVNNSSPLAGIENDIPLKNAISAHNWNSFDPEKAGARMVNGYVESIKNNYSELQKLATTPEKQTILDQMFTRFREGYKKRQLAYISAKGRTASSAVTGPARFPVSKNRDRINAADAKWRELVDYEEYQMKKIKNELNPTTFKGTSEKTIGAMDEKLTKLKDEHAKAIQANKIIRSGNNVEQGLKDLGYNESSIKAMVEGDFAGRKGVPSYALTSLKNKIKTLEARASETKTKRELADTTGNMDVKGDGATVRQNFDENRVQIIFDNIPSVEIRNQLKAKGFRWSPFNKAWQRILTPQAVRIAHEMVGIKTTFLEPVPVDEIKAQGLPTETPGGIPISYVRNSPEVISQKEKVAATIKETPKTIKQISDETKILEPNVRRILGVGAKDGTFERVDKGVYILKTPDGKQRAYVEIGDAKEVLARMATEGKKFDSVILDPAYFSRALIGGNRGIKAWSFIMPNDFAGVMESVSNLVKDPETHVYLMLSGARTAQVDMEKYIKGATDAGFKPVGEGEYKKLFKDGKPVTNVRGEEAAAERLILLTLSGKAREGEIPVEMNFRFIRPSIAKSYATEKPAELMNALIKQSTVQGENVLDPFAGSGVTGAEAIKTGRNTTLVEKSAQAVEENIKPRIEKALAESKKLVVPNDLLTNREAQDKFIDEYINHYLSKGETLVIDTDRFKDLNGEDYNTDNHSVYSKMAYRASLRAIDLNKNKDLIFSAGGPASGKGEFVVKPLVDDGFLGTIFDGPMADYKTTIDKIVYALRKGKNISIQGILPDIMSAWEYALTREKEMGRKVTVENFIRLHDNFIKNYLRIIEEMPNVEISLLDTRGTTSKEEVKKLQVISDRDVIIDRLKNVNYDTNNLTNQLYEYQTRFWNGEGSKPTLSEATKGNSGGSQEKGREVNKTSSQRRGESDQILPEKRSDTGLTNQPNTSNNAGTVGFFNTKKVDDFESWLEKTMTKDELTPADETKLSEIEQTQNDILKTVDDELQASGAFDFKGQEQINYERFVNIVKDPKLLNPSYKEIISSSDVQAFKNLAKKTGVYDVKEDIFGTGMSDDDTFRMFRERLIKENPQLLAPDYAGRPTAKQRIKVAIGRQKRVVDMKALAEKLVKKATIKEVPIEKAIKPEPAAKITKRETTLLKDRMRAQAFGARKGFTAGKKSALELIREAKDQKEFLESITKGIEKGFQRERNLVRKQIGFQRHTKNLDGSVLARAKKIAGIEEWKNASKPQLDKVLEIVKKLQPNDKYLTDKQVEALGDYTKTFADPQQVTVREIQAIFKEQDEIMNGFITQHISNNLIPTADVKEGHAVIAKVVNMADLELRLAHRRIVEVNEGFDHVLKEAVKSRKQDMFNSETNKRIFQKLSGDNSVELTPEEQTATKYLQNYFTDVRERFALEHYRKNYVTHIAKTFWEKLIDNKLDIVKTVETYRSKSKEGDIPVEILVNLDQIIGSEKFFKFALERKGGIDPSYNLRRILHQYSSLAENKHALDEVLPEGQASINLLLQPKSAMWLKRYLQNLKGRGLDSEFRRGKAGWITNVADKIVGINYIRLLAANSTSWLKNILAGETNSFIYQPFTTYLTGKKRMMFNPVKANRMISKSGLLDGSYVELEKQNFISKGKKFVNLAFYGGMEAGEYEMRGSLFLGELTDEEFNTENISPEKFRKILDTMAITQGIYTPVDSPLFVQTSFGRMLMQFGRWKITNSMLVRRILDGTYKEFKQGEYNGPNLHRAIKMFTVYALGTFLMYEAAKAGNKTANKVLSASTELFGTIANIIPNVLDVAVGNNPAQESLRALYFSYQELMSYIGLGSKPMATKVQRGLENSYVAAKASFDQLMGNNATTDQISQAKTENKQAIDNMRPTYQKIQNLKSQGKTAEAQAIVDGLSDADYEAYKKIKASESAKATVEKEKAMYPTVNKIQDLIKKGRTSEAQQIVDQMTDEDYRIYGLAKKKLGY